MKINLLKGKEFCVALFVLLVVIGTLNLEAQNQGVLNGLFTVNANGTQVHFSQGNLQYIGSAPTPYWKFADHQWDCFRSTTGQSNNNTSPTIDRDLFAWGTSGYDHGAVYYQPYSINGSNSCYYAYGNKRANLYDQTGKADWGYNAISNGGNIEHFWRTPTSGEWYYLFNSRQGSRFAFATVNDIPGVILLPDNWNIAIYTLNNINTINDNITYDDNTISGEVWINVLEANGAVFLPAAGRSGGYNETRGHYWASDFNRIEYNSTYANATHFALSPYEPKLNTNYYSVLQCNYSVRLVCSEPIITSHSIEVTPNPAEGGTVTGSGTYEEGQTCTLTATANNGYTFENWTKDDEVVSTETEYAFTVTEDAAFVANFREQHITFADFRVKNLCVANWDTDGDGELSYEEAAAVTDLGVVFNDKGSITSFNELQYFTGLTTIGDLAFYRCLSLTSIVIPNNVTALVGRSFMFCTSLTSIIIPDSVISIGSSAFYGCYVLPSIEIPNSVTSIGSAAFGNCEALTSIVIPNSVISIESEVFSNCNSLTQIVVEEGNPIYDSRNNCNAIIETATNSLIAGCKNTIIPNSVASIGNYAFRYCYGLISIEIPNSVTSIGEEAFAYCPDLTTVLMGDSVATIMWGAFLNCDALTSIEIPSSVTSIGSNVFWNCDALSQIIVNEDNLVYDSRDNCNAIIETTTNSLIVGCKSTVIPNSVISIGYGAFNYCTSLTSITIPSSVISIGNYAFYYCSGLTSITIMSDTPPTTANSVFQGVDKSIPLFVPCGSSSNYQAAAGWSEFTNYVEMCETTQTLEFSEGWNWFSTYIEAEDPVAMLQMLEAALGDNAIQISSSEVYTENDGGDWWGELDEVGVTNEQMYMILVETPCTIELQGAPANPTNHAITINQGWNWIGFPCDHEMTITEALGGFDAEEGDVFANSEMFTEFEDGEWFGDVSTLIPGQGFMYFSNSQEPKTLIIGGAKAKGNQ